MVTKQKRESLRNELEAMSADMKEKTVFATRYGLYDGLYKTTEETGRIHGMTGANVRLIITKFKKRIDL